MQIYQNRIYEYEFTWFEKFALHTLRGAYLNHLLLEEYHF